MRLSVVACTVILALGACSGGSGSNPLGSFPSLGSLNPFGGRDAGSAGGGARVVADSTVLIASLEQVRPEPALRGLIIRATGVAATQGYFNAQLVAVNAGLPDERGIVTYEFRATPPEVPGRAGPVQTRRVIAATFIHDDDLVAVRGFRVRSASNTVDLRR